MSTKRKVPAKIAHPVAKANAKKPLKTQINESEAAVTVPDISKADQSEDIIEISSDAVSSDYELSDNEPEAADGDGTRTSADSANLDVPMTEANGTNGTNDVESDQEQAEPTLGELARAHGTIEVSAAALNPQSNAVVTQKRSVVAPSHTSLGTVLSQALRTDDTDLLESCLHVKEYDTITSTIQRLDSTLAGVLLSKLASRMHRRPGRAGSLMSWVQATLVCHGGALAAQPGLVKRLSELQRVLEERARGLNSLLALKGKLDLMNAQMKLRQQQRRGDFDDDHEQAEEEGIIYVEGEESDADMANGLLDLEDDEMPITNGLIDDDSDDDDLPSDESEEEEELDGEGELDEDEVNHEDVESDDEESEAEAAPQRPSKRSKTSRGR
ncbi:NUC189-domain-containing protein [Xylariaceae sp. FL0255]|nr:NUC189-domain-containing protein [Xylariaceae sp. FL0255]